MWPSEAGYRRLFETAQDGILILEADTGQVVAANPFVKDLLGYPPEAYLGRKLWETGPFQGEEASRIAMEHLRADGRLHCKNLNLEAKDGRRVDVEVITNPFVADGTRLVQCNLRDVTERNRVTQALETAVKERAFERAEKETRASELAMVLEEKQKRVDELVVFNTELARSNCDLEQFAYVATHDLQEPLRAVTSCVQLLQKRYEGQLDARAEEFIAHAVDGARRMQTLINDLLTYSRISTRATPFAPTNCEVVLNEALANLAVAIQESGAVVSRGALPSIRGDATQLTQLFQNLVGNALKFRGDRPCSIHVCAVLKEAAWEFSVADNGIGVDPQYFERVFLVFQRLQTQKNYHGTGVGLAICKRVVERHGGRIWVESIPGQGATFCFTIPERRASE